MPTLFAQAVSVVSAIAALAGGAAAADRAGPMVALSAGLHLIQAEVANTPETRIRGLMHRASMPANRGMLFVFP